ncbi:di-heme oxidoredictase family protein [Xenophilus azovorans]|uniref:di-heme oxidoreductase family protein n=1 Tax=Xenophilus azovorans TaxID=151755 RepID=UPI00056DA87C|nr:di-heme oxidoredictase family protein [Xenophilus azovorans]
MGAAAAFVGLPPAAIATAEAEVSEEERTGGAATVHATGRNAFSFPAANLPDAERTRFVIGNSFFRRNWVQAPASTKARDGLGPLFNARSCGGCHVQDGRGQPPDFTRGLSEQPVALLMRLSVPGQGPHGGPVDEPTYGGQFQNFAVQGVPPEGRVDIRHTTVRGRFADGTPYELLKPEYRLSRLAHGPLAKGTMLGPRIAPQVIGVGLLELIPVAEIERNAREQAAAPGPIKGRVNRVWDAPSQQVLIGRFGWKANAATLAHQTGAAFRDDIGITSAAFPEEGCTPAQKACAAAPRGAQGKAPEIDDKTFRDVVFYQATVAPPARRDARDAQVLKGQQLFRQAQCATCHRPSYTTAGELFPPLSEQVTSRALTGQAIHPYTDLLLHDMGEGLADGRPDFLAGGRDWKTPPLWGIGLIPEVNGHQRLLHDGRARGVLEAILWHDGEARDAREAVLRMDKAEREALVRFVNSL